MYECEIIELEDANFNNTVHHYDCDVRVMIEYAQEHGSLDVHNEYSGEVYWDEY